MNTYEIIAIVALVVFILLGLVGMTYIIVRLCQSSETKSNDGDDAIQGGYGHFDDCCNGRFRLFQHG